MNELFITRGLPASGKSFHLRKVWGLEGIISSDEIRLQYANLQINPEGQYSIPQCNDKIVWSHLMKLIDFKMKNGDTVFVDATHCKIQDIQKYKELCTKYDYQLNVIDFSSISLEKCLENNLLREEYKRVPEEVIHRMNENLQQALNQGLPRWVNVIPFESFTNFIKLEPKDYNNYKKIVHFGDIHGCWNPLKEYFEKNPIDKDTAYIFVGDYLDRGLQNKEVLEFVIKHCEDKNFHFLEGNHELWLRKYIQGNLWEIRNEDFNERTINEIKDIDISDIKKFIKKLKTFLYYSSRGKNVWVSHGGINNYNIYLREANFIKGIGKYEDSEIVDRFFEANNPSSTYSIHGHRNIFNVPIKNTNQTFNLEGKIERGGYLRIVELEDDFTPIEIKNDLFFKRNENEFIVKNLLHSSLIFEKELEKGISSFNFTREAFKNKKWTDLTQKARGLFIRKEENKIIARSYNKFFNIDEREETQEKYLIDNLKYPVQCYIKENGYLGILSYDERENEWFIASKTTNTSDFALNFKRILIPYLTEDLKNYIIENNVSFVFEVIDPVFDPHIIPYEKEKIVLLDIIKNDFEFKKLPYIELIETASRFNFSPKSIYNIITDGYELQNCILEGLENTNIEGFVFEDNEGFMVKLKTHYYNFWKSLRGSKLEITQKFEEKYTNINSFYGTYLDIIKNHINKGEFFRKDRPNEIDIIKVQKEIFKIMKRRIK